MLLSFFFRIFAAMKTKEFFGKFVSAFLLGNLLAMAVVVVLLCFGVKYGLDWYTHHGKGIVVPKVEGMIYVNACTLPFLTWWTTAVTARQRPN